MSVSSVSVFGFVAVPAQTNHHAANTGHHDAPAHDAGASFGGRGLPNPRELAASIAVQLRQLPGNSVGRAQGPLMVNSNTNTVDTGRYTIQASRDTLTVTDRTTGENFRIWSDPYIGTSDGDQTSFSHQPATFQLPDGTKVTVTPTKGEGTTYIDNVTITRGNDAAQIGNVHSGTLHTEALRGEGRYLDKATPDGTVMTAKDGHIKDLVLANGTEIKGHNIDNIDQFAAPETQKSPTHHQPSWGSKAPAGGGNRAGSLPPMLSPGGLGLNRPNHMGPFASNMPKSWGIMMGYMMGAFMAALYQAMQANQSGAGGGSTGTTGTGSTPTPAQPAPQQPAQPPVSSQPAPTQPTAPTQSPAPSQPQQPPLLVNSNTNTVDTGGYTIQAGRDTLTVTDKKTGENFRIWSDPNLGTSDGDYTTFGQKPATFMLPDGAKVTVTPTKADGGMYVDSVTITRGNDAAQIGNVHSGTIHTEALRGEGRYLDDATPDGTVLTAKDGHIKDLVMANGVEIKGRNVGGIDGEVKLTALTIKGEKKNPFGQATALPTDSYYLDRASGTIYQQSGEVFTPAALEKLGESLAYIDRATGRLYQLSGTELNLLGTAQQSGG